MISGLASSPSGNPLLLGYYSGAPDFGSGPLPSMTTPYMETLFLASLPP
jgi:hypothetical protein